MFSLRITLEINMSEWIKKRGENYLQRKAEIERKEETIRVSNYWEALMRQIESDVQFLNKESVYADKLEHNQMYLVRKGFGTYEIQMRHAPAAYLTISNQGEEIHTEFRIFQTPHDERNYKSEKLKVISDGDHVFLSKGDDMFLVPDAASEHILKPILDFLEEDIQSR